MHHCNSQNNYFYSSAIFTRNYCQNKGTGLLSAPTHYASLCVRSVNTPESYRVLSSTASLQHQQGKQLPRHTHRSLNKQRSKHTLQTRCHSALFQTRVSAGKRLGLIHNCWNERLRMYHLLPLLHECMVSVRVLVCARGFVCFFFFFYMGARTRWERTAAITKQYCRGEFPGPHPRKRLISFRG